MADIKQYDLGIANNSALIRYYFLGEDYEIRDVVLRSLGIWPFQAPFSDPAFLSTAAVASIALARLSGFTEVDKQRGILIGEILPPVIIPKDRIRNQVVARREIVSAVSKFVHQGLVNELLEVSPADFQAFWTVERRGHFSEGEDPANPIGEWPMNAAQEITAQRAVAICYMVASMMFPLTTSLAIEMYVTAYVGTSQKGHTTDAVVAKIKSVLDEELGININISSGMCNFVYKQYLTGINENNAEDVFRELVNMIPEIAPRLQCLLIQLTWLALLSFIRNALIDFKDFNWKHVDRLTGGEVVSAITGMGIVGRNAYYGFSRISDAKVKKKQFYSAGWVATQLLIKAGGKNYVRRFRGFPRNLKSRPALECMIQAYVKARANQEPIDVDEDLKVVAEWATDNRVVHYMQDSSINCTGGRVN